MKKLLLISIILGLSACSQESDKTNETISKKTPGLYTILNRECSGSYKCSYDIRITEKLSETKLTEIARKLKSASPNVQSVFITYYLPCMKIEKGAWATSHFTPNLKVNVNEYMLSSNPACL
jgi:hypothetical protein